MDILRVLAVALVVVEHAVILPGDAVPGYLAVLGEFFLPFRIPALMFLSGLLLARSLRKPPRTYVVGKLTKIAWPYLVWTAVLLMVHRAVGSASGTSPREFLQATGPMFYLQYLLIFYAVALVLPARLRTASVPLALLAALAVDGQGLLQRLFFLFAFFMLGDVFARHHSRLEPPTRLPWVILLAAVVSVGTGVWAVTGHQVRYNPLWAVGTLAGIVAGMSIARRIASTAVGRRLAAYGPHTLIFYVSAWPAQIVTLFLLTRTGVQSGPVLVSALLGVGLLAGYVLTVLQSHLTVARYMFDLRPKPTGS